ncbi:MAG: M1 family aminopeptidase [Flavobacteriales bacterium]|nr:M1 family aminopeptidase [Flavobacteriales bacterium]
MNKINISLSIAILLTSSWACQTNRIQVKELKTLIVEGSKDQQASLEKYQPSAKRTIDILHTDLFITPNWNDKTLQGKAILYLKPYFYSLSSFELDAKAFTLGEISIRYKKSNLSFKTSYNNYKLQIHLDKEILRSDTLVVEILYTANPYKIQAYCPDLDPYSHGFYFITPDPTTPTKPYQLWTQNEPKDASLWFPTVDEPNERMTHSLTITLGDSLVSLSNGELRSSVKNNDGTRTDTWVMNQPHAPYLVALIAGKYSIVKESYKGKDVWFYVEPQYEQYAKNILGNTVEMMHFFSDKLGVEYPWNKYHQVFVRDYVSGAMENTTCVVLGEYIQQTDREQLGNSHETTIAHELFHHWFGDLVTCESWANLPLNESFANYSEYLWLEYKYGKEAADFHHRNDMQDYFDEAVEKNVPLIRFYNKGPEDMFDLHSYNKGGRILHMLRTYVGDEAFFNALQLYLSRHAYQSAEVHNLRLAFEEITGEDLNWFFNQWFLNKGYPSLEITYEYNEKEKTQEITIVQYHEASFAPLFIIPIDIDLYKNGIATRYRVWLTESKQTFRFEGVTSKPDWINVDADKILLCKKIDKKTTDEFILQFKQGKNLIDKLEALEHFSSLQANQMNNDIYTCIREGVNSPTSYIRIEALNLLKKLPSSYQSEIKQTISNLILNDADVDVRIQAIKLSDQYLSKEELIPLLREATKDKAWKVINEALYKLVQYDGQFVVQFCFETLRQDKTSSTFIATVANLFSGLGENANLASLYFENFTHLNDPGEEMNFLYAMGRFMSNAPIDIKESAAGFFYLVILNDPMWYTRAAAYNGLLQLFESCEKQIKTEKNEATKKRLKELSTIIHKKYSELYAREKNQELLEYITPLK